MKKPQQQPNTPQTAEEYYRRAGQHRTAVRRLWGDFVVSFFFAAAALIVLVFFTIAWFVSNTRVTGTTAAIGAKDTTTLLLASTGERQSAEEQYLNLSEGTTKNYGSYYDCETKELVMLQNNITLYEGTSWLAWRLNGQQKSLHPGEEGVLELYFIPQQSGLTQVELTLTAEGWKANAGDNKLTQIQENDPAHLLLNSHILFFQSKSDSGFYSGLLGVGSDNGSSIYGNAAKTVTIKASDFVDPSDDSPLDAFTVGTPYKVTIYWKWPKLLRNYIFSDPYYNDLFADTADTTNPNKDYTALLNYLNENREKTTDPVTGADGTSYYATGIFLKKAESSSASDTSAQDTADNTEPAGISIGEISKNITAADLAAASEYYNQADEYLGANVDYVSVKVEASASQGTGTAEP